mgnify:CR=1 FL=1
MVIFAFVMLFFSILTSFSYFQNIYCSSTLFFLLPVVGVRTIQSYLNFMDNITKQNGNEVGKRQVEGQTIIINQQERRSTNGLGTAGFILALLGLIFSWVPGLGWVL